MTVIKVDVISDITCVWCFIGKRTLERAIALYQKTYPDGKNDEFVVTWRPYYLNPDLNAGSVEKSVLKEKKLSGWSDAKIATATNRVQQAGQSVGINFKYGGKIGTTREAHRLIHLTQEARTPADTKDALVEKTFEAYHELENDISDKDVLRSIAIDAGLDSTQVDGWLNSHDGRDIVDQEAETNRQKVTNGVPTFFIQELHRVDGAQDLQEFLEAFIKAKEADSFK